MKPLVLCSKLNSHLNLCFSIGLFLFLFPSAVFAQFTVQHTAPANLEKSGIASLQFKMPGLQPDQVRDAYLKYWFDNNPNKVQKLAVPKDDVFNVDLDLNGSSAGMIFYAFFLEMADGTTVSFPEQDPENNPIQVGLVDPMVTKTKRDGSKGKIDFTVLSPEPGGSVNPSDVVVAITLFYKEGDASSESFVLKINGTDVTSEATISPYFISWTPKESPKEGDIAIDLSFKNAKGRSETLVKFKSKVSRKVQPDQDTDKRKGTFVGNGELAARQQSIAGSNQDFYRGNFNVNGQYGIARFAANGLATSLENSRLQPQNRYAAELYLGKWFEVQAGHIYPAMNNLVLNGLRMNGVNAGLYLFNRNFGVQAMYGELNRTVSNLYTPVQYKETATVLASGDTVKVDGLPVLTKSFDIDFQNDGIGTYKRQILGGRINIGNGRIFGLGISALKVEDDTTSIFNIRNASQIGESYLSSLTPEQRALYNSDPSLINIKANNPQAKGNFVFASDLSIAGPKGRFRINADVAANLLNEDIGEGVLNKERAEDLGFDLDDGLSDILDQVSALIIINENMKAFPIKFKQTESGDWETEVFVPKGIFAGQSTLSLNVLNNNLTAQYMWMGPDYTPLSNTGVRRDIAGFSVNDRIRLFRNRVYINGGYDQFSDNLLGTLEATTTTKSTRAGLSWYPFKSYLPRISLNYRLQNRDNGFTTTNDFLTAVDPSLRTRAVRSVRQVTPDSLALLPNARFTDTYQYSGTITQQIRILGSIQDLTVGYTLVDTRDREFFYGNYKSDIYNANLTSRWGTLPLKTNLAATINFTKGLSGLSTIDIYGYSAGFELLLLNSKLQLNGDLALAYNTVNNIELGVVDGLNTPDVVFDDYFQPDPATATVTKSVSYIANASARYNINKFHALAFLFSYTSVQNRLQSGSIPNDQVFQARYILSF